MSPPERRKIDELATLHRLEPTLRDIFVEGSSDKHFLDWFLHENGAGSAAVAEIDLIEIPAQLIIDAGLEDNNKARVIVLARELEQRLGPVSSITYLVDSDLDRFLGTEIRQAHVVSTDFTCMEMYFYDARCINKFLQLAIRGFPKTAAAVLTEMQSTLTELFLIRAASSLLGWNLKLTQFEKQCALTRAGVTFDRLEYVRRVLLANGRGGQRQRFSIEIETCGRRVAGDRRNFIHGHDFVSMLAWYIRAHGKTKINREIVERALPTCVESNWISGEEMFKTMLRRATA